MKYRILLITDADVNDRRSRLQWSGTPYYCGRVIKKRFQVIGTIIADTIYKKKYQQDKPDFILSLGVRNLEGKYQPFVIYLDDAFFRRIHKIFLISQKTYDNALVVFTFSEFARRLIIKEHGIAPSKVVTVGAGPNLRRLPSIDSKEFDGRTILFIGKSVRRKGGLVLLEAFKKVKNKIPDARLIMISRDVYKYSKQINLKDYDIIIYGLANKQTLGYWYRRASVFVMPSLFEPFGIAFLEAMAYKLPCIGTNICAMPEIIDDGKTGFLVKPKDAEGLAEKIIYLLRHKEESRRMGESGRKKVEQYYLWDHAARRIEKHMRKVLNLK